MKKILIEDFLAESKLICDDAFPMIESYQKSRYPNKRYEYSKYLSPEDALLIADTLISESQASELDIQTFTQKLHKLLNGEKQKVSYDTGIRYAYIYYLGGK